MTVKVKPMKVTEEESKLWNDAAEKANKDGKPSFNHWARSVLNAAAKRVIKKHDS